MDRGAFKMLRKWWYSSFVTSCAVIVPLIVKIGSSSKVDQRNKEHSCRHNLLFCKMIQWMQCGKLVLEQTNSITWQVLPSALSPSVNRASLPFFCLPWSLSCQALAVSVGSSGLLVIWGTLPLVHVWVCKKVSSVEITSSLKYSIAVRRITLKQMI